MNKAHSNWLLTLFFIKEETLKLSEIKQLLAQHLPDYMLPQMLIPLDEIPLSANGKLDRKALPKVEFEQFRENEFCCTKNSSRTGSK